MRTLIILAFLFLPLSTFGQTQLQINQVACSSFEESDRELNETYKKILSLYSKDSLFLDRLKKAQNVWIKFRDAQLEMVHPEPDKANAYGSTYVACKCEWLQQLTKERNVFLMRWVVGSLEGEMCSGSIRIR